MFGKLISWILSVVLAFGAGAAVSTYQPDEELKQNVSDHMDVIVDEAAGIVDDVTEAAQQRRGELESELENNENYRKAKEFKEDVEEIIDHTKEDIDAHFGTEEETEAITE